MSTHPASYLQFVSNRTCFFASSIASILPQRQLPRPSWAPSRLPRSWERLPMVTGVPRTTLSLCPECNREAVDAVVHGGDIVRLQRPGQESSKPRSWKRQGAFSCARLVRSMGHLNTCFQIIPNSSREWRAWRFERISRALGRFSSQSRPKQYHEGARRIPDCRLDQPLQYGLFALLHECQRDQFRTRIGYA